MITEEKIQKETITDDTQQEDQDRVDADILARLRARKEAKEMPKPVEKVTSIKLGVVSSGQAGSRLSEGFYRLGYPAIAINTATQDLEHIAIPPENKLHLNYGLGGAAKDLEIGRAAADAYRDQITELVESKLDTAELLLFCTSLGGGSGAGSAETIIDILSAVGKPVVVITVLPSSTDDSQTKSNALVTLSRLTKLIQSNKIHNLIVVDNAKIETIYSDVSQLNFFKVSNRAIIDPIDAFNTLSSKPSSVKGLDPTEFGKLFTDGQGLTIYGEMDVRNYEDPIAIAEAVMDNLNGSLLASGFNLKQSRYVGVIFAASEKVWGKIPNSSINYAMAMVNEACGSPVGVFRGIYTVDSADDSVKVYSMFSGLGLPESRIDQLKTETKELTKVNAQKDEQRNLSLKIDTGDDTLSEADRIKQRISAKKSAFGKLTGNAIDRRR